jgi:hypothetical protein
VLELPRRGALIGLLLATNGCITSNLVVQRGFWDECAEEDNCGAVVGGVLAGELVLYGVLAGVAVAAGSDDEDDGEPPPMPAVRPAKPAPPAKKSKPQPNWPRWP